MDAIQEAFDGKVLPYERVKELAQEFLDNEAKRRAIVTIVLNFPMESKIDFSRAVKKRWPTGDEARAVMAAMAPLLMNIMDDETVGKMFPNNREEFLKLYPLKEPYREDT